MDSEGDWDVNLDDVDRLEKAAMARHNLDNQASCRPSHNNFAKGGVHTQLRMNEFMGSQGNLMANQKKHFGNPSRPCLTVNIRPHGDSKIATESVYNPKLVASLKSIPGHEWKAQEKLWIFPKSQYHNLVKGLTNSSEFSVTLTGMPSDNPQARQPVTVNSTQGLARASSISPSKTSQATGGNHQTLLLITLSEVTNTGRVAAKAHYHEGFKSACQSISALWDPSIRAWTFPKSQLEAAVRVFAGIAGAKLDVTAPLELPVSIQNMSQSGGIPRNSGPMPHAARPSEPGGVGPDLSSPIKTYAELGSKGSQPSSFKDFAHNAANDDLRTSCTVKLLPLSSGKIAAKFPYYEPLVSKMRSISGAAWESQTKQWLFPVASLDDALNVLNRTGGVKVEPLQPLVLRALRDVASRPDDSDMYQHIPKDLESKLLPFQREGIKFALKKGGRALIADEMGLGKTLQAICIARCYREEWPVLVIVPSALRLEWAMAIHRWLQPEIEPYDISVVLPTATRLRQGFMVITSAKQNSLTLDGMFCIVGYDTVHKLSKDFQFKVVIADEAHYMKSPKARRTTAALPFLQKAKRAILLTGTPALNRPNELHKLLEALQPKVYGKFQEFGNRYCLGGTSMYGQFRGCSNPDELHALVKSTVMVRRQKMDVLPQLPAKRRQQVLLELDAKSLKVVRQLMEEMEGQKAMYSGGPDDETKVLMNKIYLETAKAKVKAVEDYIETLLQADCKFLVFAHHKVLLNAIEEKIKNNVGYIRIDGQTSSGKRSELVTSFQEQESIKVAVLSIKAAGVGITLTAASTVVFAEMTWTPGDLVQAEDRAHRIGQANSVNVIYLHAPGTVDDIIWESVERKLENIGQVMDGRDCSMELEPRAPARAFHQATLHSCMNSQKSRQDEDRGLGSPEPTDKAGVLEEDDESDSIVAGAEVDLDSDNGENDDESDSKSDSYSENEEVPQSENGEDSTSKVDSESEPEDLPESSPAVKRPRVC